MNQGLIVTAHNVEELEELLNESEATACNLGIIQQEAFRRDWNMDGAFVYVMDGAIDHAIQQLDAWAVCVKNIIAGHEFNPVQGSVRCYQGNKSATLD